MTLHLRPVGRGNWSVLSLTYDQDRHAELPTLVQARVNMRLLIGGSLFRVCGVHSDNRSHEPPRLESLAQPQGSR